jgi:isopentenyl-diphosphate delta-isomerase
VPEELLEIFDDDGRRSLGVQPRSTIHSTGAWHRGVHAFLFDESGRLLIQKRAMSCDTYPGAIDCSLSEHLALGESFVDALARGCIEELGVEIGRPERLLAYKMQYGPTDNMICELYSGRIDRQRVRPSRDEITEIDYADIDELAHRISSEPSAFTSWFHQQLLWYGNKHHSLIVI